ncbi:immunoglobulin I-set domain protein, partial [Ancylostoma duodenale]
IFFVYFSIYVFSAGLLRVNVDITSDSTKYDVTSGGLIIHDLKKSDSGSYSCIAKNSYGMTSATARLTSSGMVTSLKFLKGRPAQNSNSGSNLIEYGPTNQSVVIGTNIVIPCEVSADYEANANVMWFMNDELIPATGNPSLRLTNKKGGLLIQQVGPDNIGEYRCTVSADGREESASAFLRII